MISTGKRLDGVKVVGFQAPLSFLNSDRFQRELVAAADEPGLKLLVLEASAIDAIDYTAAQGLVGGDPRLPREGRGFRGGAARIRARAGGFRHVMACSTPLAGRASDGATRLFHSVDEATSQAGARRGRHFGAGRRRRPERTQAAEDSNADVKQAVYVCEDEKDAGRGDRQGIVRALSRSS